MKGPAALTIVWTTLPTVRAARQLGRLILNKRLCACFSTIPIASSYWWKNKIESHREVELRLKTVRSHVPRMVRMIIRHHPYQIPQIIVLPALPQKTAYQKWVKTETGKYR